MLTNINRRDIKKPVILIVDDVPKNIQVLGTLLSKIDCELAVAMNGQQALDTVKKIKPDLILLDVMMPVMDGHEVCEKLKADKNTNEIPVIFLTAKIETEDIVKGFELGAVDYVTKPFIGRELVARVKTQLDFKNIKDSLKEEIVTKNKFFSIISHDLRGSFGIVSSFVDLVLENKDVLSEQEIDEILIDIGKTTKTTLDLLENLLNWARSQTGTISKTPERIDIEVLVQKLIADNKKAADKKAIQLQSEIKSVIELIVADKNMCMLIFRNLLSNALKFTPRGGNVTIKVENIENFVKISVSDSGIGISSEKIKKLFNIDTKISTHGTENEMGNGLGLILCKEFVLQNNGEIGIESEENKGTSVWFTLPVYKKQTD